MTGRRRIACGKVLKLRRTAAHFLCIHFGLQLANRKPGVCEVCFTNLIAFYLHRLPMQDYGGKCAMVGTTFGRYLIQDEIGRGGMGVVYRARDVRLDRLVAIKVLGQKLQSIPSAWGYLLKEARIASALNHPFICTIYDVGEENEKPYIAMEYV